MESSLDMGKEKIWKLFLKYSIPSVIATLIFSIYIVVDGIFVGRAVGSTGLAAVNIAMPFFSTSMALGIMVSVGGSTITSIELGKGNSKEGRSTFSLAFYSLIFITVMLSIITLIFTNSIVNLLGAKGNIIKPVKEYLVVLCFFLPVFTGGNYLNAGLRVVGKPNYSMFCSIIGSVLNIILDYILVIELNQGVLGAAIASGIAFTISFIFSITPFLKKSSILRFCIVKIDLKKIGRFFYNGSSEALTEFAFAVSTYLFNIILMNKLGELGVSAFSIIQYIAALVIGVFLGISTGVSPIISYNYGAKQTKRINEVLRLSLIVILILGIICTIAMIVYGEKLIGLFVEGDTNLIETTVWASKLYSTCFLINGINIFISAYFTALEDAKTSAIISILRGIFFISIAVFVLPMIIGDNGIWISVTVSEVLTLCVSYVFMKKSNKTLLKT